MSLSRSRLGPITPLSGLSGQPQASFSKSKVCANCGKASKTLSACSRCREVDYCSKECQLTHWKSGHKLKCGKHQCNICLDLDPIPSSLGCQTSCSHHFHKVCVEGIKEWGIMDNICPDCRPAMEEGPAQKFEVAIRRLFVLERRCARGDSSWDALAESEESDLVEILKLLRETSSDGFGAASTALGLLSHLGHGVEKDVEDAVKMWKLGADQGDARSAYNLSVLYKSGQGVEKDDEEAAQWNLRAAKEGMVEAMNNMGTMYEYGDGVEKNGSEAVSWTRKAAEAGYLPAQVHLATLYLGGVCVTKDLAEGMKWLEMAAVCGDAEGQLQLGLMHEMAFAPQASDEQAVKWYTAAADQGHTEALFKLGCMYIQGRGLATSVDNVSKKSTNNWLVLSGDISEENRVANALACFVLAGSRGHELSVQLVEELRPKTEGGEAVPLPRFTADSDPAAVVAAITTAAAQAANHTMDLGDNVSPNLSPGGEKNTSTKKNKGKKRR